MKIQVIVPSESIGKVIGDLSARRAQINETESRESSEVLNAYVPLVETFQYTTNLRSMTQGRGTFTMELAHYDVVPTNLRDKILNRNWF
jgi:elongation factor G